MLELEVKYLELTREVVLKRAKDIFDIDVSYCVKMFDLGLLQLAVNFEMQRSHNEVKHQKVGTFFGIGSI